MRRVTQFFSLAWWLLIGKRRQRKSEWLAPDAKIIWGDSVPPTAEQRALIKALYGSKSDWVLRA